jgi:uncharacterized membrane protein YhaH (DUF805 family)|tara:strand:- start:350 stop:865 length:516 start_codon:yes stop_codon:yes gene_type:complete
MKKFFQFSESINGTTYFLRCLFSAVLSIPFIIIIMIFLGVSTAEYAEIDFQNPESFDQQAFQEKIESNPKEFLEALKDTFTPFWVISIIISLIPAIWFGIATYYKRVAALFQESKDKIFTGLIAFEILADYYVIVYGWGSESIIGSAFLFATLLIFIYMVFQNSGIEEHEG